MKSTRNRMKLIFPLTAMLMINACALETADERHGEQVQAIGQGEVFAVCSGDQPVSPAEMHQLIEPIWPQIAPLIPDPIDPSQYRIDLQDALRLAHADYLNSAPAGGCVVDCEEDPRSEEEVTQDGDGCTSDVVPTVAAATAYEKAWEYAQGPHVVLTCSALRELALMYEAMRMACINSYNACTGCPQSQLDIYWDCEDRAYASGREIAKAAILMGCAPPSGWSHW